MKNFEEATSENGILNISIDSDKKYIFNLRYGPGQWQSHYAAEYTNQEFIREINWDAEKGISSEGEKARTMTILEIIKSCSEAMTPEFKNLIKRVYGV